MAKAVSKRFKDKAKQITEYLESKEYYQEGVDDNLIDEIAFNLYLIDESKKEIQNKGILLDVSNNPDKPYYQTNMAITTYKSALKTIQDLYKLLGLSVIERKKLDKLLSLGNNNNNDVDEFDRDFN